MHSKRLKLSHTSTMNEEETENFTHTTSLEELDNDVLMRIFELLSVKDLLYLREVNSRFKHLAENDILWKHHVLHRFGRSEAHPLRFSGKQDGRSSSWMQVYLFLSTFDLLKTIDSTALSVSIENVALQVHPKQRMDGSALQYCKVVLMHILTKWLRAITALSAGNTPLISKKVLEATLEQALSAGAGEILRHARSEGRKASRRRDNPTLVFSLDMLRDVVAAGRYGILKESALHYIAGVLEYVCAELVELGGNASLHRVQNPPNKYKIQIRQMDLRAAVAEDEELANVIADISEEKLRSKDVGRDDDALMRWKDQFAQVMGALVSVPPSSLADAISFANSELAKWKQPSPYSVDR